LAPIAVALLVASGCSSDDATTQAVDESLSPTERSAPACSDVWRPGKVLKRGYDGCLDSGVVVAPALLACKNGSTFTTYDDRFYAVIGERVNAVRGTMASDRRYSEAYNKCLRGAGPGKADQTPTPSTAPSSATPSPETEVPSAYRNGHIWLTTELEGFDIPEVRLVQQWLNLRGYDVVVDGSYGPQTAAAVAQFQSDYGLIVDGIVGPQTYAALQGH